MLTSLKRVLAAADKGRYAVGAFNINNLEILRAVIDTAVELKSPVIIQTSEGAIEYAGMDYLVAMVRVAAKAPVPVVLHVDHGKDLAVIRRAISAGYTSVMIDASALPYKENVAKTKKVVGFARPKGVSVEAEIGALAGVEDKVSVSEKEAFYTDPDEAVRFVRETGCDALAISIGTAHGPNKSKVTPELDIRRLAKIRRLVKLPIVLHGASGIDPTLVKLTQKSCAKLGDCGRLAKAIGIPDDQIRAAIRNGIRKINIDSDLRLAFTAGMREAVLENHDSIDPRKLLLPSIRLMRQVVAGKMRLFGSAGKAR
jgi:fructose-bisphosphate aldolase class II